MPLFERSSYTYTQLFCEENIWKLIASLYTNPQINPIDVLFILNKTQTIALFEQLKSEASKPVIWDYHVILTAQLNNKIVVFDFDSRCEFPSNISDYFESTFPSHIQLADVYQPYIKPIKANYYLKHFYSNRQHMEGIINKDQFPDYDIIQPENKIKKLTLAECRNVQQALNLGRYSNHKKLLTPEEYFNLV